jgi:hypothetical protein
MLKISVYVIMIFAIGAMLITATTSAYACMANLQKDRQQLQQNSLLPSPSSRTSTPSSDSTMSMFSQSNATKPKLTQSNVTTTASTSPGKTFNASTPQSTTPSSSLSSSSSTTQSSIQQTKEQQKVQTQKEIQKRSLPTSIILVNLRMPAKNTTDYGIVDLTVTLNNATKIRSFNTTSFSGDNIVMPFRFSPKGDKINIQVGDKFNLCASGEFLAAAVCQSDTIKTKNPPITRTNIELG